MLTVDDLTRAAETVVARVNPDSDRCDSPCRSNHLDIARAGVEEGLQLALRLLRHQHGGAPASDLVRSSANQHGEHVSKTSVPGKSSGGR